MSDTPQGPDWWQASDDRWYPPPRPEMPGETTAYPAAPPTEPMGPGPGAPVGPYGAPGTPPSPYGGIPAAPPGAGGPNRTALFVTLGVLGAVALVVLIFALASGGDDDPQAGPTTTGDTPVTTRDVDTTDPVETTEGTEPTPGDASAIEVVEEGWSTFNDAFGTPSGSYGFVIENTGDEVIIGAELSVTVYNEADGVVTTASGTVGSLQPGQRLGLGGDLYGDDLSNGVGDIDVQTGQTGTSGSVPSDGELTVSGVDWEGSDFGMTITFSIESTYSEQIDMPGASAIFRNVDGEIIGGASSAMTNFIPANGNTGGEITTIENVPEVSSIDVYIDPGGFYY